MVIWSPLFPVAADCSSGTARALFSYVRLNLEGVLFSRSQKYRRPTNSKSEEFFDFHKRRGLGFGPGSRSGRPDDLTCALHGTKVGCHDLPQSHSDGEPLTPDAFQASSTHVSTTSHLPITPPCRPHASTRAIRVVYIQNIGAHTKVFIIFEK